MKRDRSESAKVQAIADELAGQSIEARLALLSEAARSVRLALEQARLKLDAASDAIHGIERAIGAMAADQVRSTQTAAGLVPRRPH